MSQRNKIIISIVAIAVAFAVGRYSVPKSVSTSVETNTDKTKEHVVEVEKIEVKKSDGTTITKTRNRVENKSNTNTDSIKTSEVVYQKPQVNVSVLVGTDVNNLKAGLVIGASISKPLIGPVSLGAWGFLTGMVGISAGLQF